MCWQTSGDMDRSLCVEIVMELSSAFLATFPIRLASSTGVLYLYCGLAFVLVCSVFLSLLWILFSVSF